MPLKIFDLILKSFRPLKISCVMVNKTFFRCWQIMIFFFQATRFLVLFTISVIMFSYNSMLWICIRINYHIFIYIKRWLAAKFLNQILSSSEKHDDVFIMESTLLIILIILRYYQHKNWESVDIWINMKRIVNIYDVISLWVKMEIHINLKHVNRIYQCV